MKQSWTKFLPLAVVAVIVVIVVIAIASGGGDDDETEAAPTTQPEAVADTPDDPDEPEPETEPAETDTSDPEPEDGTDTEVAEPEPEPEPLDCSRNEVLLDGPCRPAGFEGDNGGATANGVFEDSVNLIVYVNAGTPMGPIVDSLAGISRDEDPEIYSAYAEWFNANFETYGRTIEIIHQVGPSQGPTPADDVADAAAAATENRGFVTFSTRGTDIFFDELARLESIGFAANAQATQAVLDERAPYQYLYSPTADEAAVAAASYYCERMHGQPAEFAGGSLAGAPRKVGVVSIDTPIKTGQTYQAALAQECGVEAELHLNVPRGPVDETLQTVARWAANGVTTVIWADVLPNRTAFASAATGQDYFPEHIQTGIYQSGLEPLVRRMDPEQAPQLFGIEMATYPVAIESAPAAQAYLEVRPDGDASILDVDDIETFNSLLLIMYGIEAAGPVLDPFTFEAGLFSVDPIKQSENSATFSFGDNGPGSRSAIDDYAEVWWNPQGTGADGGTGTFYWLNGGQRYAPGEWPDGPPTPGVEDGSPQPGG